MNWAKLFLGLVVACAGLQAQRPGRSIDTFPDGRYLGFSGDVEWSISFAGQLSYVSTVSPVFTQASTGISVPGGLQALSVQEVLVCGRNAAGQGVVEHWGYSAGALTLRSSAAIPASDIAGVAYASGAGCIYLLDSVGKRVLRGTWAPSSSLSGVVLNTWAAQTAVPDLANADERTLVLEGAGVPAKLRLMYWPFIDYQAGVTLTDAVSGLITGSFAITPVAPTSDVSVDQTSASEGGTSLKVFAPIGVAFEVVDLDLSAIVGTGTGSTGGVANITLGQSLVLGHRYTARRVGQPLAGDTGFTCIRRYGYPEVFADGTAIRRMYFQLGAEIGKEFYAEVGARNETALTSDLLYSGLMLIGFRIGGTDPIVPYGNNVLLATGSYLPATGVVAAENGWGLMFSSITIPNDPDLVGLTFLIQFVMEDGQDYRLSEIYGANIGGPPAASFGASPGGGQGGLYGEARLHLARMRGRALDSTLRLLHILSRRS